MSTLDNEFLVSPLGQQFVKNVLGGSLQIQGLDPLSGVDRTQLEQGKTAQYKVMLLGNAGAGKTTAAQTLCHLWGREKQQQTQKSGEKSTRNKSGKKSGKGGHVATQGIHVHSTWWPVREERATLPMLVRYDVWDVGADSLNSVSYLRASCSKDVDACVLVANLCNPSSFDDMREHLATAQDMVGDRGVVLLLTVGDESVLEHQVTQENLDTLRAELELHIMPLSCHGYGASSDTIVEQVTGAWGWISERLLRRDLLVGSNSGSDGTSD